MIREFDNSYVPFTISPCDLERAACRQFSILRIEAKVAAKLLNRFFFSVCLIRERATGQLDRLGLPHKRARQPTDYQGRCLRGCFFMFRIPHMEHVTRILYQSMLKTSSGAEERPPVLSRKLNATESSIHVLVGAARCAPKRIKRLKHLLDRPLFKLSGGKPRNCDRCCQRSRGMTQRLVRRTVRLRKWIEIADDADGKHAVYSFSLE